MDPFNLAIVTYIILIVILYTNRPNIVFDTDSLRSYGMGNGKTLMTPITLGIIVMFVVYLCVVCSRFMRR